jgi:S1-C subfamily serine protease
MYHSSLFLAAALVGTTAPVIQPVVAAKSASEIEDIARAVTVEVKLQKNESIGSGVIIDKKGDVYTLVTNKHVVCGGVICSELQSGESYSLGLSDGQNLQINNSSIRLFESDLDLAFIQFRSDRNYLAAKVATPSSLKIKDKVYAAGFPREQPGFTFSGGEAIAVVNKRLTGDRGGYTIIYNALTLPGMSGGGIFDANGQLVAIHGQGDRYQENTEIKPLPELAGKLAIIEGSLLDG